MTTTPKVEIIAFGNAARRQSGKAGLKIVNPFNHPRSIVSDFTCGEQLIKAFVSQVRKHKFISLPPMIIMHPLENYAGGLTQIEIRALQELAMGAGASQGIVWEGKSLSDKEILSRKFPECLERFP